MKRNPVGWFEIYVDDMNRARKFYEATLVRKLSQLSMPELEMWAFEGSPHDPGATGALVKMPGFPPGHNSVLIHFSVPDCGETAKLAVTNGGKLQKPKTSIGPYGFFALVIDTEGNMIGLHSMS